MVVAIVVSLILIIGLVFVYISIKLPNHDLEQLISGYNTLSDVKKRSINKDRIFRYFRILAFSLGIEIIIFGIIFLLNIFELVLIVVSFVSVIMASIIIGIIVINRK